MYYNAKRTPQRHPIVAELPSRAKTPLRASLVTSGIANELFSDLRQPTQCPSVLILTIGVCKTANTVGAGMAIEPAGYI